MKKMGLLSVAFTFAGCLLGAGYVSGQELWQYFGCYGQIGILGLIVSIIIVAASSSLVLWLSDNAETGTVDRLMIRWDIPWLRVAVGILFSVLYLVIGIIMIAGIASLGMQMLGISRAAGSLIAVIFVMTTVYFGFSGMVRVFDLAVPVLVVAAVVICFIRIRGIDISSVDLSAEEYNPMLGPWYMSSFNYATLNLFGSIGIIAPLANHFKKRSYGPLGIVTGAAGLIIIAILLILAIASYRVSTALDLPMLALAQHMGKGYGIVYGILLLIAMYGNANATLVAALNYSDKRMPGGKNKTGRIIRIVIIGIISFILSLTGFSNLVATVYPVIGYIGIASLVLIIEHAVHLKRLKRVSSKNT